MATRLLAIGLAVICTLFTSIAQLLYKNGADKLVFNFFSIFTNFYLLGGLILYTTAAIILIISLKYGDLSVIYPIIATGYVWVSFLSIYFFKEEMNNFKWAGVIIILIGISMIGYGGSVK